MSPRVKKPEGWRSVFPLPMARTFTPFLWCVALVAAGGRFQAAEPPPGKVLVEVCEKDIPRSGEWPAPTVAATESFLEDAFGLFELPQKYISTGVRADRAFPTLVRASARVTLPAGKHRLLLRSRGPARLIVDGRQVL